MIISWANDTQTYVRVEVGGSAYQIPCDPDHPDWQNIKAMIDAKALIIPPYEPPQPPDN